MTGVDAAWRYACALGAGRLLFELPAPDDTLRAQPPDAVALAQALAACEPLLAALEAWCGCGLDPQPLAQDEGCAAAEAQAVTLQPGPAFASPPGLSLSLPLAWLADQSPPPAGLLHWPTPALQVEVATYPPDAVPPDAAAGALLLPGAFEPRWPLRLLWPAQGLAWSGTWGGPGSTISVSPAAPQPLQAAVEQGAEGWSVLLDEPCCLPLPLLLGWPAAAERATAPPPPPAAATQGLARLVGPGAARPGRIVPVLQGAALLLPATESAAWT